MPKGTDVTYVNKLHNEFGAHGNYLKGDDRRRWSLEFGIKHYAGPVIYTVHGFLDKNKDVQQDQLFDIMSESTNPFVKDLTKFQDLYGCYANKSNLSSSSSTYSNLCNLTNGNSNGMTNGTAMNGHANGHVNGQVNGQVNGNLSVPNGNNTSSSSSSQCSSANSTYGRASGQSIYGTMGSSVNTSKGKPTVADTFRQQLTALVDILHSTNPWYVRCIKPNSDKTGDHYDDPQVLAQLRYLGMNDIIRIRREGYPIHYLFSQFSHRFKCILNQTRSIKVADQNATAVCRQLIGYALSNLIKQLGKSPSEPIDHADYYQMGKRKIFLKLNIHENLELEREYLLDQFAVKIQACWRRFVVCREFNRLKRATVRIQRKYRAIKQRLWFQQRKRAAITIQSYVRGMFARECYAAMKEMALLQKQQREREEAEARRAAEEAAERERQLELQKQLQEAAEQNAAQLAEKQADDIRANSGKANVDEAITYVSLDFLISPHV